MTQAAVSWAIGKLDLLLTEQVKLLSGVHSEIKDVRNELESIKSFIRDADARADQEGVDSGFKTWVKQVREVAYHIEDVIDEYMHHLARNRDQHGFLNKAALLVKKLKPRHKIASQIQEIKKSVVEIRERSQRYNFDSSPVSSSEQERNNTWHDPRVASLFIEETELVGIESPKNELISRLVDGKSNCSVISVVGMGGLGKTTLAKKVFDSHTVASHFDCKAWITVSQSYKVEQLLGTMINEFQDGQLQPAFEGIQTMDERLLIKKLRDYLSEKRYVVVFDDVWRSDFWGYIKIVFPDSDKGSRIIITTRNEDVAPSSNESSFYYVYKLQPLPHEKAFELFCEKVFQPEKGCCPSELEKLSHAIVEKCEGLPLAIVTIGGLLATKPKTLSEWKNFYNGLSSSLASDQRLSSITKILSLSFHDLPYYLKSCFLYLSLFPEDYHINCHRLIRLWIAEGFIIEKQGLTLEEIAEEYLMELIHRGLIQVAEVGVDCKARGCRVHDLMGEIVLSRSKELNFHQISVENFKNLKGRSRHLSIDNNVKNIPDQGSNNPQTHSVITFDVDELPKSLIASFAENFKLLRSLDFQGAPLDYIPEELGNLWHLRYLSLRKTNVKILPKSICKLCNLETLDLKHSPVYDIPIEISSLLKLRYLVAYSFNYNDEQNPNFRRAVKMHGNVGCLKALQKLNRIELGNDTGLIHQLERLTQLQKLGIAKLKRENGLALCTALEKMTGLISLAVSSINEEEFLELQSISQPPPFLQSLYLHGPLTELPQWIPKLMSLVKLSLNWSRLGDGALQVLQALPNLLCLAVYDGYNGEQLHFQKGCFPKLKALGLRSLIQLNVLIIEEGALPLVEKLRIGACPKLKEVPSGIHFLRNLKKMILYDIQREFALGMLPDGGNDYWKVEHIPSVFFWYKIKGSRYRSYKLGDSDLIKHLKR